MKHHDKFFCVNKLDAENKNNNQGTSDGSNTSPDNNLRSAETDQQQQQGTGVLKVTKTQQAS